MNFNKKFEKYEDNAHIQKKVATKLIDLLPKKEYKNIFEIGVGTGIFTRKIINKINYTKLIANDKYFESEKYVKDLPSLEFLGGNIESIDIPNSDIIVSSSVFQWINDKKKLFKKISEASDTLVFSIYIDGNLQEITEHFGVSLKYNNMIELINILTLYFADIKTWNEKFLVNFDTPLKALKHLKNTGVTGIGQTNIKKIRSYKEKTLTYNVGYFVCKNEKL